MVLVLGLFVNNLFIFFFDVSNFLSQAAHSFCLAFLIYAMLAITLSTAFKGRLLPELEAPKLS